MNFLFDLYGTLADIHTDEKKNELWEGLAAALNENDAQALRSEYLAFCDELSKKRSHRFVEFDLLNVFEKMLAFRGISKDKAPELARKFRVLSRERLRLFPCVKEMLAELKQSGAGVYLVSNAQSCFTRDELDELEISGMFDGIVISSDAGVKKPHREIFDIAAQRFGIELKDCVYVGNDLHDDVLGANAYGMRTVYIETEQSGKYPGLDATPTYIVRDHSDMKRILLSFI
ncbi:MAG: HAD family hydrolase [Clostridia bacterium]|nr:HAD family hydrolase [Clostridia bacterium]